MKWKLLGLVIPVAAAGVLGVYFFDAVTQAWAAVSSTEETISIPTTKVRRGDVVFMITAQGAVQGGKPQVLAAPMVGSPTLTITSLRKPGELVHEGDVIVQFDTTEEEFKMREAEADLAEAEQQVIQAKAEIEALEEEGRLELLTAKANLRAAELDCRRNPLLAAIAARQNELALASAQDHLRQLERDLDDRQANAAATIAIHEAARAKAKTRAETARRNIEMMTLRARSDGYVSIHGNEGSGFFMGGMVLPPFQEGDTARAGMAVAQIPDMKEWEITAQIDELDRGHLAVGQEATVKVVALPGRDFRARVKTLGGTTGPPWNRRFECRFELLDPTPDLRAGMSARLRVTLQEMKDSLWIPSQALFESDGRKYMYVRGPEGFVPADVKLVRRGESRVVIEGIEEGREVALASPEQMRSRNESGRSATEALKK